MNIASAQLMTNSLNALNQRIFEQRMKQIENENAMARQKQQQEYERPFKEAEAKRENAMSEWYSTDKGQKMLRNVQAINQAYGSADNANKALSGYGKIVDPTTFEIRDMTEDEIGNMPITNTQGGQTTPTTQPTITPQQKKAAQDIVNKTMPQPVQQQSSLVAPVPQTGIGGSFFGMGGQALNNIYNNFNPTLNQTEERNRAVKQISMMTPEQQALYIKIMAAKGNGGI